MKNTLSFPIYWPGLYPVDKKENMNLLQPDFYKKALDYYCKNGSDRKKLLQEIKLLSFKVDYVELFDVMEVWKDAQPSIISEIFDGVKAKKESRPNLVTKFKNEVIDILEARKMELHEKEKKDVERVSSKLNKTNNELLREKEINNNLLRDKENGNKIVISEDFPQKIYDLCSGEIFTCDYVTFRNCLEAADFRKLEKVKKNKLQHITYKLSAKLGKNWYSAICKTMDWEKSICSSFKKTFESDKLIKKIEKVIQDAIK